MAPNDRRTHLTRAHRRNNSINPHRPPLREIHILRITLPALQPQIHNKPRHLLNRPPGRRNKITHHNSIINNHRHLAIYSIVLLGAEIKSHITTASSIITGSINPAIIKIPTTQTTDFTKTLVANSITITPGTLTVKIDKNHQDLYIHCLNYNPKKDISTQFEKHAKNVIS